MGWDGIGTEGIRGRGGQRMDLEWFDVYDGKGANDTRWRDISDVDL